MVLPSEEREVIGRTLEDRLAEKFDILQLAREQRNDVAFEEIARSVEVLLKVIPDAYNILQYQKNQLEKDLDEQLDDIERRAQNAPNKINADSIRTNESFQAKWDFREVYEEIIIELLQQFKLVPIRHPVYGGIEPVETEYIPEEIEEEEEIPSPPEKPKEVEKPKAPKSIPKENKPKLSIPSNPKKEKFEV